MQLTFHLHAPASAQSQTIILNLAVLPRMLLSALVANAQTVVQFATLIQRQSGFMSNALTISAHRMNYSDSMASALIAEGQTMYVRTDIRRPIISEELIR